MVNSDEHKHTEPDAARTPVVDTVAEAEKMDLEPIDLPNEPEKILTFPFDLRSPTMRPDRLIAKTTVQMVRDKRQLTTKEYQTIGNILKALSSIAIFTTENVKLLEIDWVVSCILGENPRVRGPYEFPESFQKVVLGIQARLEDEVSVVEVANETPPTSTSPPPGTTGKKRKRRNSTLARSTTRELPDIQSVSYRGLMRGIVISDEGNASYKLADRSTRVPANVFGHNGLQVGDWWPKWICALRDGAHGRTQGGIYSRLGVGAFSIVVSGKSHCFLTLPITVLIKLAGLYDDLDQDYGNTLYYSGNKSHDNEDPDQPCMTSAIKALQQSRADRRPIRVLRTSGGKARHCPAKGLRYDGLYRIVDNELAKNRKGGAYIRFQLVRDTNQPNIDLSRPSQEEREIFDRLKSSI